MKRKAKREFFQNRINKYRSNSTILWGTLKLLLKKLNDKSVLNEFPINGKPCRSLQEICDGFVEHYTYILVVN